nr:hypothetical protein [Tanacetum cinerariifolium]
IPDESTVISADSNEGTGPKQESEHSEEDKLDDEEKDDKEGDVDDEDDETKSDEEDIYKYKIRVRKDEDKEMNNAEVDDSVKGDEEITNAAKVDTKKTSKAKVDAIKTKLPPTSSILSVYIDDISSWWFCLRIEKEEKREPLACLLGHRENPSGFVMAFD